MTDPHTVLKMGSFDNSFVAVLSAVTNKASKGCSITTLSIV